jgi:KaiC/GvpD/RAD55 family RecA-like ATPase
VTTPAALSRLASVALGYAARRWFVFPLEPRSKVPFRGTRGFQEASVNPTHVERWWQRCPAANIGLWPGPSGLVVVDVDGPDEEQRAQELGLLTEQTLVSISGRAEGGRHLYFSAPTGEPIRGNGQKATGLVIRGQDGYVVLPPSVHPATSQLYRWVGTIADIRPIPPTLLTLLRGDRVPSSSAPEPSAPALAARTIAEGGRNNALARVAGALLAKHALPEAAELLHAWNVARCSPPLSRGEVENILTSIGRKESRKASRFTAGGTVLTVGPAPERQPEPELEPQALADQQVEAALARGRLDLSTAPRWQWADLHHLVGPMTPGDLIVVGGLTGNGKTSLLLSQLDYLAEERTPTLYLPLEVDPADVRRRWAAWKLGLDFALVTRNEWGQLPEGSQEAHEAMLEQQGRLTWVQFPPDRRVSLGGLKHWMRWGVERLGAGVVVVDHFHRLDFGGGLGANYRVQVTDTIRAMKDLAREYSVALVAAAQLNQDGDGDLDRYFPPSLRRLKESAGIGEEADSVLMLSRRLQRHLDHEELRAVRAGHSSVRQFEEPGVLVVTCRKHRLDDSARDRSIRLSVVQGRVHGWIPTV